MSKKQSRCILVRKFVRSGRGLQVAVVSQVFWLGVWPRIQARQARFVCWSSCVGTVLTSCLVPLFAEVCNLVGSRVASGLTNMAILLFDLPAPR